MVIYVKNKNLIRKISFNMTVISGTLLGGYLISNHPLITSEGVGLAVTCATSGVVLMKSYGRNHREK